MSDRICIASKGKIQVEVSAQDLTSCCHECAHGCRGGNPFEAWRYWKDSGIVSGGLYRGEGCRPYALPPCNHQVPGPYKPCGKIVPTPPCKKECVPGYNKTYADDKSYDYLFYLIEEYLVFWIVFDFYLLKKIDQRTCIKFCVKNEIKCADAFRMLTVAYGEATLDRSNVYRWYKMFSEGREDVNDEERAGRPNTSTTDEKINEVEKMILANRRITVREVAEDLNISIGSCHSIFINDLGMRRVAAKFVYHYCSIATKNSIA
ncbi:hypothetical protein LAZ67_3000153 [Cordylochernes scorpioides]|uniref:Peptidase C1A papain C-terminal domain-containing protein n=1 Tax=Cordylochernes scorpioides TaxID=51811 RepID=A0ABY6K8Y1_9ARAC|nr:hypothetical protein LAZ67_3000153 [Cordylochernes scorpioides]